jgi:lipopolysaccharide transport protein LptA
MKDNRLDKMIIIGDPAHLNQKPKQQHPVSAEAKRIEYLADSDIIKLYGDAQVRQGTQNITGEFIQYNRRTSLINANGNKNKKDRVNITITPQKESTSP